MKLNCQEQEEHPPRMPLLVRTAVAVNLLLLGLVLVLLSLSTFFPEVKGGQLLAVLAAKIQKSDLRYYPSLICHWAKGRFAHTKRLELEVGEKNLLHLEFDRQQALDEGIQRFDPVPATLTADGRRAPVQLRLKGTRQMHYGRADQLSFRVEVQDRQAVCGMRTFSLHKPQARNYIYEWIFLEMARREGLVAPRYLFVDLTLDGEELGLYALEEHYDRPLLENNHRPEGPVIYFDENAALNPHNRHAYDFRETLIRTFGGDHWLETGTLPLAEKAIHLLEAYRRDELSVSQTFDVETLARYFALVDLNQTYHGAVTKNIRFYYNPALSRLEPVPFDGHYGTLLPGAFLAAWIGLQPADNWTYVPFGGWFRHFFNDPEHLDPAFVRRYFAELERIADPAYLDLFFAEAGDELEKNLDLIYGEFPLKDMISYVGPEPFHFRRELYYERQAQIRQLLQEAKIRPHLVAVGDTALQISVLNLSGGLPVEIAGLRWAEGELLLPEPELVVASSLGGASRADFHPLSLPLPPGLAGRQPAAFGSVEVLYRVPGTKALRSSPLLPWRPFSDLEQDLPRRPGDLARLPFLKVDQQAHTVSIPAGNWTIEEDLVVPEGYTLVAEPGAVLALRQGASVIARAPVRFVGTAAAPIRVCSPDGTGGGMALLQAGGLSHFSQVHFECLGSPQAKGWRLNGGLTLYESPALLEDVRFSDSRTEDAANLIRSRFTLRRCGFANSRMDALDVDFGEGEIEATRFGRSGNDAIDLSGSAVELRDVEIDGAGDKGLSAGEASQVWGRDLRIGAAAIAVASKDSSTVELERVSLSGAGIGLAAYRKKEEYPGGTIAVRHLQWTSSLARLYLIERGSALRLDDQLIPGDATGVIAALYPDSAGTGP